MSLVSHPSAGEAELSDPAAQLSDLSEKIWHELSEQVPRAQVFDLVVEAAAQFEDATVTAFVPLLIQRQVREKLQVVTAAEALPIGTPAPAVLLSGEG